MSLYQNKNVLKTYFCLYRSMQSPCVSPEDQFTLYSFYLYLFSFYYLLTFKILARNIVIQALFTSKKTSYFNKFMPNPFWSSRNLIIFTVCAVHHLTLLRINLSSLGRYRVKHRNCLRFKGSIFQTNQNVG